MYSPKILGLAGVGAALFGATLPAHAFTLNFDGPGSTAGAFAPIGLTIGYGQYVPTLDGFGDPIAGSEHWEIDPAGGSVPVLDPSTVGWGTAPSPSKALDARDGPVLLVFDTPFNLAAFSATLDNSPLGDLSDTDVKFYSTSNTLLASISVNQTTPGFVASVNNLDAVKTILLPATAFYDNVTAVPEPGAMSLFGGVSALAVGCFRLRSRRA